MKETTIVKKASKFKEPSEGRSNSPEMEQSCDWLETAIQAVNLTTLV